MNLTQVMNVTLPDPPAARLRESYPCVSPKMIARDHHEREGHMIHVIIPDGPSHFFRFSKQQFELIKLFDGKRSYAEIARIFAREQKIGINAEFVQTFAENMEKKDFWYRSQQDESITLFNKLAGDRHKTLQKKHGKSAAADLAIIELIYFDPDKYLTWIHEKLKFAYSTWFTVFSLCMVVVMCTILGARWDEVWTDSVKFYNFTEKGLLDLVEFFGVFALLGAVHETAHGMTCKHYGGESHKMGAFLMYLMPGVFCDVTQIYVYGGRWQRVATLFAGVWSEIIICTWVTILWWLTPQGSWVHDIAYKFILSGGIFVVIINLNPLARMDGYYIFCELTRHFDLKGQSTSLVSNTVRKYIFRIPATVPVLPWKRRLFFLGYGFWAGMYSYMLLLFFVRISYRIFYNYSPEWAFVPAGLMAAMIFKSRIKKLMAFLKALYLDKREMMRLYWKQIAVGAVVAGLLMSIPVWRESVDERFVLEPSQRAVLRANVPGTVLNVSAEEGTRVAAGQKIAQLQNLEIDSASAKAAADYGLSSARSVRDQLKQVSYSSEENERRGLAERQRAESERAQALQITSPIAGTVMTSHVRDLVGSYLLEGAEVAEIADTSVMRAQIYVKEDELQKLEKIDRAILRMDSQWRPTRATFESFSPVARELAQGLTPPAKYKGMHPPAYYVLEMDIPNQNGELLSGMTGSARIYGERRSTASILFKPAIEAVLRRAW
jgi:putative peptide zinc metalloprotease protein